MKRTPTRRSHNGVLQAPAFYVWFALFSGLAVAGPSSPFNLLPMGTMFPTPSGIIFPGLNIAGGVNPAALPQVKKISSFEFAYSPAPTAGDSHTYFGSVATAKKDYGLSAGYLGSLTNVASHGYFAAGGVRSEQTSFGVAVRNPDMRVNEAPATDLGILAHYGKDLTLGLVLYGIESSPQIDIGIGFGREKNYNFEINLLIPQVGTLFSSSGDFTLVAATTVYLGFFGLNFKSTYNYRSSKVDQTVSVLFWFFKTVATVVQYSSPNRSSYGLIFTF